MYFKYGFTHFAPYVVHLVESLQRLTFRNGGSRFCLALDPSVYALTWSGGDFVFTDCGVGSS